MTKAKLTIALGALMLASLVRAADDNGSSVVYTPSPSVAMSNMYVGAGLGQSRTTLGTDLSNTSDMSYGFLAGYQFNRNMSVEASYVNLGKVTTVASVAGRTAGVGLAGLASIAANRSVTFYGKFGFAYLTTSWDSSPVGTLNTAQSTTALNWGAGVSFEAAKNTSIRLGFDRYSVGSDDPVTGISTNLSLAAILRF